MIMENYIKSMAAAAIELAAHPEYSNCHDAQERVCRKWGFSLDDMSDAEFQHFSSLVQSYCGRR